MADDTTVYAPVPKPKDPATDPHVAKPGDSAAVAAWRERMGQEDAQRSKRSAAASLAVFRWNG